MSEPRFVAFRPPRPITGYLDMPGHEVNGLAVPWHVLDSRAETLPKGRPDEYVVSGMDIDLRGRRLLRFTVNPAHVEGNSDVRYFYPEGQAKPPRVPKRDNRGRDTEALPAAVARPVLDHRRPRPIDEEPIPESEDDPS